MYSKRGIPLQEQQPAAIIYHFLKGEYAYYRFRYYYTMRREDPLRVLFVQLSHHVNEFALRKHYFIGTKAFFFLRFIVYDLYTYRYYQDQKYIIGGSGYRTVCVRIHYGSSLPRNGDFIDASTRPASNCVEFGSTAKPELNTANASPCLPRHCKATPSR